MSVRTGATLLPLSVGAVKLTADIPIANYGTLKNRPTDNSLDAGIAISGRPALSEAGPILDAAIAAAAAAGEAVLVDCTSAEHLNGAVIQVLLCLKRDLERAGRKLVLTNVSPPIQRFVELSGLGASPAPRAHDRESPSNES